MKKIFISESEKNNIRNIIYEQSFLDWFKGKKTECKPVNYKPNNWKSLYSYLVKDKLIDNKEPLLIIWGPSQKLYYTSDGTNLLKEFPVSTSKYGFGSSPESKQTPTGLMETENSIVARKYQVLINKSPTDTILGKNKPSNRVVKGKPHRAEVLTALVELSGLEDCNENTFDRSIYLHGTNFENQLGTRASSGCIRVSNENIIWLSSNIKEGTKVYVYGG